MEKCGMPNGAHFMAIEDDVTTQGNQMKNQSPEIEILQIWVSQTLSISLRVYVCVCACVCVCVSDDIGKNFRLNDEILKHYSIMNDYRFMYHLHHDHIKSLNERGAPTKIERISFNNAHS